MSAIGEVLNGRARWALLEGDSMALLPFIPENSVDTLVTDPPAGIGFMGKTWDSDKGGRERWQCWLGAVMLQAYRAMKPGAHGLVWALPRTSHWTATALENAGFEVRDRVSHLFGTGFPKNAKAQLKPAVEDWWLVRKPLEGPVAANVAKWGTGALNVDGCRLPTPGKPNGVKWSAAKVGYEGGFITVPTGLDAKGRWPANLTLDESAAALLDAQSGTLKSGARNGIKKARASFGGAFKEPARDTGKQFTGSEGGASRFFYVAKTSTAERNAAGENKHPTVKPLALMRWLCRLVTPPGGVVLDPFTGSGSTGAAALQEGMRFVGMERDEAYARIARARLEAAAREPAQPELFAEASR